MVDREYSTNFKSLNISIGTVMRHPGMLIFFVIILK